MTLEPTERTPSILFAVLATASLCVGFAAPAAALDSPDRDAAVLDDLAGSGTQDDPYEITNATELQAMDEDRTAHYVLVNDVDASETADWNRGSGFDPVGGSTADAAFTGSFDGRNHTITGLTIDRPTTNVVGLFSITDQATVEHVELGDIDVRGGRATGGVAGVTRDTEITGVTVTGRVSAEDNNVGGLVGLVRGQDSSLSRSHAAVAVSGADKVGGLAGFVTGGAVDVTSATGAVSGGQSVGGLVGVASRESAVVRSYATGSVDGSNSVGGLVGTIDGGDVSGSYAAGDVNGGSSAGGVVGSNQGRAADLYWDEESSGQRAGTGAGDSVGTGLTTAEMSGTNAGSNMAALEFGLVWTATDEYPVLRSEVDGVSLSAPDQVITDRPATATVSLTLADGRTVTATQTAEYGTNQSFLSLDAGRFDTTGTGTAEVTATVAGRSASGAVSVVTPPDVSIDDSALRYDRVGSETAAPVDVALTNDGGADGQFDVVLSVDGTVEATRTVTVPGHSTRTVQINYSASATGTYPVAINGTDLGELTVVEEPETSVASATMSERLLALGDATTVEATLENAGDAAAGHTVELTAGGETVATRDVVVPADGTTVTFDYTAESVGEYDLAVDGTSAGTLTVAEMGSVSVESVSVPDSVGAGESYEVTATLANSGGLPITTDVTYSVGGSSAGSQTVEVPADGTTVSFEATAPEDSESIEHAVRAGDAEWTGGTTVDVPTQESTATAESGGDAGDDPENGDADGDGDDESSGDDGGAETTSGDGPGFGVVAALVALVALLARTRSRSGRQ
ncbi:PGF-CTERM sorting domain-containing protein [Halosimplex salinum]|uniref:PGF-CTERM sorting domain-containing protein n=1 Tax=Halosimplex salinum TaxID=1710538 RepID=UPI000F4A63D3|nr:PGF-CTERM sorting domain-containing protein [Halosimplex salinum]